MIFFGDAIYYPYLCKGNSDDVVTPKESRLKIQEEVEGIAERYK